MLCDLAGGVGVGGTAGEVNGRWALLVRGRSASPTGASNPGGIGNPGGSVGVGRRG